MVAAMSFCIASPLAAQGIGEVLAVIDKTSASGRVGERTLGVGTQVFIGDRVVTDATGEAQLLFTDGTRLVVGANSSLVIDDVLFRGEAAEKRFVVNAQVGAFRITQGDSAGRAYSVQTPSATISMLGTAFDFTVTPKGGSKLVLVQGEATMCGAGGENANCETVEMRCALLTTDTGNRVWEVKRGNGRAQQTREYFPYMTSQSSLLEPFRIDDHDCDTDAPGGLSNFALDESRIQIPRAAFGVGALTGAFVACLLSDCGRGGGGSSPGTNNSTN